MRTTDAQMETAERAVRTFNKMLPALEGFVEALTGRQMRVQLSSGGTRTDNRTIFVTPPYALGKEETHHRALCDLRDENGVPLCEACDNREKILSLVYHEISHVAFGTFAKLSSRVVNKLARMDTTHAQDISRKVGKHLDTTYNRDQPAQVAAILQEYMPLMANAYEDIRVDCRMREARPGTFYIQKVLRQRMFSEGAIDPATGERMFWKDKPLNSQAVIASVIAAEGDSLEGLFDPYIVEVYNTDEKLRAIVARAPHADTVEDSFVNAVEAMIRLQQYGFFDGTMYEEPEPEPAPEEEEESDDGEPGTGDGADDSSEPVRESEGGGEDSGADEPGADDAAEGGGDGSDAADSDGDEADSDAESGSSESSDSGDGGNPAGAEAGTDGAESDAAGTEGEGAEAEAGDAADSDGDGGAAGMADSSGAGESGEGESSGKGEGTATGNSDAAGDERDVPGADDEALGEVGEGTLDPTAGSDSLERPPADRFGDSDSAQEALEEFLGHDEDIAPLKGQRTDAPTRGEEQAIDDVVNTFEYFERPSRAVKGVKENKTPESFPANRGRDLSQHAPESILGPALLVLRRALEENKRSKMDRNRKSGRVNSRVLGRRAWNDDDRLFQRKSIPAKRDYAVLIGIDVSGSTQRQIGGGNTVCDLAVRAAYAQAELCSRLGIKFAVYAHSGSGGIMEIFEVKAFEEPWGPKQKDKMGRVRSRHQNLDGHTLEFYRKKIERIQTTDRVIMYYSDGAMPAENYDEELSILKREIKYCAKKDITLMAVGVLTDAPEDHGLDTARLDSMKDISKVVKHLGDRIMAT